MGKFVKEDVRELCPSTTGPLLPTMTDSLLASHQEVLYKRCPSQRSLSQISARAKNKEGPKPGEHVQLFRMERDRNKGF